MPPPPYPCIVHSSMVARWGRCLCDKPVNRGPALPARKPLPDMGSWVSTHSGQLKSAGKTKRNAIQRGAPAETAELVLRVAVFLRDGGRCRLCGRPVTMFWRKRTLDVPREDRFTMDHIIPVSKGGEHTYANIQSACDPCNTMKANS